MEEIGVLVTGSIPISKKMEALILQIRDDDPNIASKMFLRYYSTIPEIHSSKQNLDSDSPQLNFSVYGNLVDLYLEGSIRKLPELPVSLNQLTLAGSRLEKDPMMELGKRINLKKLQLRANSYIGSEMDEEEEDEIEDLAIQLTSRIKNKGKDLLHEEESGEEIVEIQTATLEPDLVTPAYINTAQCSFQKKLHDELFQKQLELEKHKTQSSMAQA
ncbi:Hypothetical predicted protein [Olea europaea subsp. europaea]|uniref:Uncharacterized protein n=1 Tax=Olea europaea subsp. europaea TaxID=158383 RepID=A0A8S0TX20_OLEEU|nr:Hypothetical predicted protein [Olea europaea subsp. europaea]